MFFVSRRCPAFLFILYIAFSYCLSFSSDIVDYIVFLPRTTHTRTMAFIATRGIECELGDGHLRASWVSGRGHALVIVSIFALGRPRSGYEYSHGEG